MKSRRALLATTGLGLVGSVLTLAACSPTRTLNAMVPLDTFALEANLSYGPDARHRLDVYRPTSQPPASGWPVVLFFYGGSWDSGAKGDYRFVGEALASRGLLCVIADYRLYPQVTYPDFLHDSALALAHVLRQAKRWGGDAGEIHVMGHSAGAYNAAMLALDPRWLAPLDLRPAQLAGWIGLAGPYNFLPITVDSLRPIFHAPDTPPDSQPIAHADVRGIRSFLGVARSDTLVDPQRNTARLAERLQRAGTEVSLRWYDRANHMTLAGAFARPLRWVAPVLDDVEDFVKRGTTT